MQKITGTNKEMKFSFLRLFNSIKGIHKVDKDAEIDYIEKRAPKVTKEKFEKFFKWCEQNGVEHPKLKYPVYFGSGDAKYPGMIATEDIGNDEVMMKIPAKMVLSTKVCFSGDINHIYFNHPDLFGKHVGDGEDNVLNAFVLYELGKGDKSFWKPMFDIWPRDTEILMNWDFEDIEWLQDETLQNDVNTQYQEFLTSWNNLYKCLSQYPDYFSEESLGLYRYKWVYMLTTNRCFGSNWPGICSMIPFAELINHENVDVQYDYVDQDGKTLTCRREENKQKEKEERLYQMLKKKLFLEDLKEDLEKMENEVKSKINGEEIQAKTEQELQEEAQKKVEKRQAIEFELRAKLADGQNKVCSSDESSQEEEERRANGGERRAGKDDYDYSSGIESDNDVDLLVEQEVIHAIKIRKEQQKRDDEEKRQRGEMPSLQKIDLTKEQAQEIWNITLNNVPEDYNFIIRTYNDGFPKGSQVYLCYGRMSNREMLKRYGFCLNYNKYNYLYIKLRLEQNDPEFLYRKFVLRKFFSVDPQSDKMDISSRHFRIYFQKLNTKVIKFIKILNFNIKEDDISCIVENRSLSLEYISLQKLKTVYEEFLNGFPTTYQEDNRIMREEKQKLDGRKFFALVYRSEMKKVLINQINLIKILLHILERLMKGLTLEFAVTRVFELESKKEFVVNRIMMDNYLTSLEKGLQKNQIEYLESKGITMDQMQDQQRRLRLELPKVAYRQFEIKGYDKMIERILEAPLKSSQQHQNIDLENKLLLIKEQLQEQVKNENQLLRDCQIENAHDSSYESYYDEEDEKDAEIKEDKEQKNDEEGENENAEEEKNDSEKAIEELQQ